MTRARMKMRMKMKRIERPIVTQCHVLPVATGKCIQNIPTVQDKGIPR